jgi:hypothetical protein
MNKITFELEGVEYKIPEFLNIEDYVKVFKVKDLFEDEFLKAKVVSLLTDCPIDVLLNSENHKVDFLAGMIFSMVPTSPYKLIDRFELDGVEYGYLPSYKEITYGEFVDLDTLLTKKPEEIMNYLHIIAAIMYRPIVSQKLKHDFKIEKYDVPKMQERAELFKKKLDIKFVLGGQFFFINFGKIYSSYTPQSLKMRILKEWMKLKLLWQNRKVIWKLLLKKDLDGTSLQIELQREMLRNTMQYMKKELLK